MAAITAWRRHVTYDGDMLILLAKTNWGVLGTWAGVAVALLALVVGSVIQLRKRSSDGASRITQRSGRGSKNYQAGRDLTIGGDKKKDG